MEELKRLNTQPASLPETHPTREEWERMLDLLEKLEQHTAAQTALLRALSAKTGTLPHPGPHRGTGAGCGGDTGDTETGWETEREAFFSAIHPTAPIASATPGWADMVCPAHDDGSITSALVGLGQRLEQSQPAAPVRDATTTHQHTDRKTLRQERQKKIALGHKEDDHEDEPAWQQTM